MNVQIHLIYYCLFFSKTVHSNNLFLSLTTKRLKLMVMDDFKYFSGIKAFKYVQHISMFGNNIFLKILFQKIIIFCLREQCIYLFQMILLSESCATSYIFKSCFEIFLGKLEKFIINCFEGKLIQLHNMAPLLKRSPTKEQSEYVNW